MKSRAKRHAETVSFDEIVAVHQTQRVAGQLPREGVALLGVDTEFQRRLGIVGAVEAGAPVIGAPVESAPAVGTVDAVGKPGTDAPVVGAPVTGLPITDAPAFKRPSVPKRWRFCEDGHTLGEEKLYRTMYRLGHGSDGADKMLAIGERPLAEEAGLSVSNVSIFLTTLVAKLAIENRGRLDKNRGTLFLVRSPENVLAARTAAGLTHIVKKGRSVLLTNTQGVPVVGAPIKGASVTGAPVPGAPVTGTF